jgi:predicted DsbA family dithiol-disulfide isomerase
MPRAELRRRYGVDHDEHMRGLFARHALDFNPPEAMPNSRAALRLTELARDRDLHEPFHDRVMDALWSEGRDLGDPGVLRSLAVETGLDAAEVEDLLGSDAYLDRVLASTQQAHSIGINGIPAFLLDGRLLVLGAQPQEVFERAFERLDAA